MIRCSFSTGVVCCRNWSTQGYKKTSAPRSAPRLLTRRDLPPHGLPHFSPVQRSCGQEGLAGDDGPWQNVWLRTTGSKSLNGALHALRPECRNLTRWLGASCSWRSQRQTCLHRLLTVSFGVSELSKQPPVQKRTLSISASSLLSIEPAEKFGIRQGPLNLSLLLLLLVLHQELIRSSAIDCGSLNQHLHARNDHVCQLGHRCAQRF